MRGGEVVFFFQAEDGIRDIGVTGVQTCALPISPSLREALEGCTTVYHSAGIPEQWRRDVGEFTRVNVEGTRNVVEAALAAGVERFIYTSTDDVLVQAPGATFDESVVNPNPGQTPYQRSKQEADRIVTAALDRGLPAVFLHPAGLYGPAPFLVKGLNDLLMQLAKGKTPAVLPGGMAGGDNGGGGGGDGDGKGAWRGKEEVSGVARSF